MNALHNLARAAGLAIDWRDAYGRDRSVSDEALTTILGALGYPADGPRAVAESLDRLEAETREADATLLTAVAGRSSPWPEVLREATRAELQLEGGARRDISSDEGLPAIAEPGYHWIEAGERRLQLAVAPPRALGVRDLAQMRRAWGAAVQIPSLRDSREEPFGDFGALAEFAGAIARRGAHALAISPCHALFPVDPARFGPYAPSTRLFLNVLLADPSQLEVGNAGEPSGNFIDWERAIPERMRRLRRVYEKLDESQHAQLAVFRRERGVELERHSRFDALHAHFFAELGSHGWPDWPPRFHDPESAAVGEFAAAHGEEVRFGIFLQWLAERSLAAAQGAARENGMAIGLIADLAVGVDPGGSQAWSRPGALLSGLSIGAPPDPLGPDGQNWGVTGFSPHALNRTGFRDFILTIRAALRNAGGVRIDHAMGLQRLWVVPHGASPREGAYLTYPRNDLMRLMTLESYRARALVVGEDLGTVPSDFHPAMEEQGFLGMRVLWFERQEDGGFSPPSQWSQKAAAMTSTHDLPTVAGWWRGRDIDWTWQLGRGSDFASEAEEREHRTRDRERLWQVFRAAGTAEGEVPPPERPEAAVTAAAAAVGSAACELALVPAEDLFGLTEQPNLPGTVDEYPNWRRRMPRPTADLLADPAVSARIERLNEARGRP